MNNDPWLVQNAKGRVRQAEHGAPAKPTLEVFMPPGFASIEHTEEKGGVAELVIKMKNELITLERLWKEAAKNSPKRRSDGMPMSAECQALWLRIGELNKDLGQLRGSRPKWAVGAQRWRQERRRILQHHGCSCEDCEDSDCSVKSVDGGEVSSNLTDEVSQNDFLGGHS